MASQAPIATHERGHVELVRSLHERASSGNDSRREIVANVVDKIAAAKTVDDVLDANESGPEDVREFVGRPLTISNLRYQKSEDKYAEGGVGVFVIFDAEEDNGTPHLFTTGAANLVTSLHKLEEVGGIPGRYVVKAKPTANGELLRLGRP